MLTSIKIENAEADAWIVMVHGMSQNHKYFEQQVNFFREEFNILLIDLPGHGLAKDVTGPFGHIEVAGHVVSEIYNQDISNGFYWGTHTGATVAPLVFAGCPTKFTAMVLECPCIPGDNPTVVTTSINRARQITREDSLDAAIEDWWHSSPWFDAIRSSPTALRAEKHKAMIKEFPGLPWHNDSAPLPIPNAIDFLRNLNVPTLVYTGSTDHPDFQKAADQIAALVKPAKRMMVPGAGGFPAWERHAQVNKMVANFLSSG